MKHISVYISSDISKYIKVEYAVIFNCVPGSRLIMVIFYQINLVESVIFSGALILIRCKVGQINSWCKIINIDRYVIEYAIYVQSIQSFRFTCGSWHLIQLCRNADKSTFLWSHRILYNGVCISLHGDVQSQQLNPTKLLIQQLLTCIIIALCSTREHLG